MAKGTTPPEVKAAEQGIRDWIKGNHAQQPAPAGKSIQDAVIDHARSDMANVPSASHDPPEPKGRKIGEGHAQAWLRAGFKELQQAFVPMPDSNIRPVDEPGLYGSNTPQVTTQEMGYDAMLAEAASRTSNQDRDRGMGR